MVRCESRAIQTSGALNIWSRQRNTVNTLNGVQVLFRCISEGISGVIAPCVCRLWTRSSHRVIRRSRKARGLALRHRPVFHDGTSRSSVHRLRPALAFLKALDMETRSLLIRAVYCRDSGDSGASGNNVPGDSVCAPAGSAHQGRVNLATARAVTLCESRAVSSSTVLTVWARAVPASTRALEFSSAPERAPRITEER